MEHIISLLVENKFGVLARVAGLFSARGFNIESLSVGPTLDPTMSSITVVTQGDERILEQITKQVNKLIDVIKVVELSESDYVERETALIKIHTRAEDRAETFRIIEIFRAKIVDSTPSTYTVEITGARDKVDAFVNQLRPLGIKELVRSGRIAMPRDEMRATNGDPKRRPHAMADAK
ncbi:MAG: acetolactate synthase small subunit [Nitrospiria bacterium]